MRKCFSVFLIVIALSLTSCRSDQNKPSDKAISCAKEAIKTGEGYLSYDIDYEDAMEKLDELQEDMLYVSEMTNEDEHYYKDFSIETNIMCLASALISDNYRSTNETYDNIQGIIDDLYEDID